MMDAGVTAFNAFGGPIVSGAAKGIGVVGRPIVNKALTTETGALIGDTVKAGAAKAAAAKATVVDSKEAVKLATSRTVDKATAIPKATTAGVKSAARLSPAKEKALTQAANRENQLAEAAKNLDMKYNRVTGQQEFVTDTSNMVIQTPLTRGDAFKSAYDAQLGISKAEAASSAAYRLGEREAAKIAKADFTPSHGRSTNDAIRTAQAATRESARANVALTKDINSAGGKAEEAIKGLEKDVETAFPKPGEAQGSGKGKSGSGNGTDKNSSGDGSGKVSGDGSGNVPGSGKGNGGKGSGSENSNGNGLRNEPGTTATKTGVPGTNNPRGGRPAPPERDDPFTKPAPEKLKPNPIDGSSGSTTPELPDLTSGKIGLLEREDGLTAPTKPAVPAKPAFGPNNTRSPGVPDGAGQVTSGSQLGSNIIVSGATNAGAQAAVQPVVQPALSTTPTPTTTKTTTTSEIGNKGGGGGGGGKKPPPGGGMTFGEQDVKLRRIN